MGFWGWNFKSKQGGGAAGSPTPPIPKVQRSMISDAQRDGLLITWDRDMTMTCDAHAQIDIIIDGAAPVHPDHIIFHPSNKHVMGLMMPTPFQKGQVVTWAYDDSGPCDITELSPPNAEAENQTYGVQNLITDKAFNSGFSAGFH